MRYYSEEDVSEMLAKEFDEASSYSKPYSGVKMSDYPSIEIPHSNWHTGTPTEEGWYLMQLRRWGFKVVYLREGEISVDGYMFDVNDTRGGEPLIVAWMPIEPFKED